MAEDEKKKKTGIIIEAAIPPIFTIAVFFLARATIDGLQPQFSKELNFYSAMTFSGATGILFALSCAVCCKFFARFAVCAERIKEFFADARFSLKMAAKGYIFNIREKGADYLVPVFYIIFSVAWFAAGISNLMPLLQPYL